MTKAPTCPNPILVLAEQLRELPVPDLVLRYEREWGRSPRVRNAAWLRKQIARRVHERECGGLSKLALARLEELIGEITADGVLIDGAPYASLSAAANAVTGTHTSGTRFFGVRPPRKAR